MLSTAGVQRTGIAAGGDFIMSSPEPLIGLVILLMLRTFARCYSSAETEADNEL